jgi:hypothetical protein
MTLSARKNAPRKRVQPHFLPAAARKKSPSRDSPEAKKEAAKIRRLTKIGSRPGTSKRVLRSTHRRASRAKYFYRARVIAND